jgi:heme-degrading monooxygenase HmoA
MAFISVTRLRVRTVFYLLQFAWYTMKSKKQAERASGFLGGRLMLEAPWVFWTVTVWESEAAMRAYRSSGAHMKAMPKLLGWCDEASYGHWEQESTELPSWAEAHRRMVAEGRLSKVKNPSAAQLANKIAEPRQGGSEGQSLKPVLKSG